jgi:hypothetical protein
MQMREMTVCGKEKRKHGNPHAETRHLTMENRDMLHEKQEMIMGTEKSWEVRVRRHVGD